MSKLVIKQDLPVPSFQEKLEGVLRVILPLLLLGIVVITALSLYVARDSTVPEAIVQDSPYNIKVLPLAYKQQYERLDVLRREFDSQDKTVLEGYDKHSSLVAKAEAILLQLSTMDRLLDSLDLSSKNRQELLARHQYQKDYWESKRVFQNLRLSRFNEGKSPLTVVTEPQPTLTNTSEPLPAVVDNHQAMIDAAAKTAPKIELPADFCPLFGPGAAACKPDADDKKP
ncbi:hypothetical protein [Thiothrix lacustris]|uniref:hypothetical protein n=1 Tax=Thiothrix lacustris TaxID=525917 RepID=UPI0004920CA8|nr:hypothetical protein [Thiothrix lacustris]